MKRLLKVLLITLLALLLGACSSNKEKIDGVPNPIKEYDSIDEINDAVGVHLIVSSMIPASDFTYSTINDEIAQVKFKLDNHSWTMRGAKITNQDISGINDPNNAFEPFSDYTVYLTDYYIDRLFINGIQYTITVDEAKGYDEVAYSNFIFTMENAIKNYNDVNGIAGSYMDKTSQRATMDIRKYDNTYEITVSWAQSADETTYWYMAGTFKDNRIQYTGEDIATYGFDNEGNQYVIDSTAANNVGYFEFKDGLLYWTGAAQDQCKECIFEKMPD